MVDFCQAPVQSVKRHMRVLVAPQEFKGSLSARQAAAAMPMDSLQRLAQRFIDLWSHNGS